MIFRQLFDSTSSTYTYLLADPASREALLIDPVFEQARREVALVEELGLKLHWTLETHEVIHLVAGRMTVTPDGGEPVEIGAGDVAVFPLGWSGSWTIHETVRKVYAIF